MYSRFIRDEQGAPSYMHAHAHMQKSVHMQAGNAQTHTTSAGRKVEARKLKEAGGAVVEGRGLSRWSPRGEGGPELAVPEGKGGGP